MKRALAALNLSPEWHKMTQEEAAKLRDDWRPKLLVIAAACGISEELAVQYYRMAIESIRATQERKDRATAHEAWLEENRLRREEAKGLREYQERIAPKVEKALDQLDEGEGWRE